MVSNGSPLHGVRVESGVFASPPVLGGESTGGGAGLVGQGEAQGEPVGCRGDGEGVRAHEWHVARPLVVGLEGDEATQLVLGTRFRACAGVYTQG